MSSDGADVGDPRLPGDPEEFTPVREVVDLPDPRQVAREAMNRAKAAARERGVRPGRVRSHALEKAPPERKRGGGRDPQLVVNALGTLLAQRGWVEDVSVGGVIGRWREVVGDEIADHCQPLSFEERALVVRADSTAWATQLRLLTPQLLKRLAVEVGDGVVDSVTVLGPVGPSFRKGRRSVRGRGPRDTFG